MSAPHGAATNPNSALGQMTEVASGIAKRMRITWLVKHASKRPVLALYVTINCAISILILGVIAVVWHQPMVFPSLGPTAFLLFFLPLGVQSAPRNVFEGQLIAVVCGFGALLIFGLVGVPTHPTDMSVARICAVAIAIAACAGFMVLFDRLHAPACASTAIIAIGVFNTLWDCLILMIGVALLILQSLAINRLAGYKVPWWGPIREENAPA